MKIIPLYFSIFIFLFSCSGESLKSDKVDVKTVYQKHKATFNGKTLFLESEFHTNAKWDRLETEKFGDHIELVGPAQIVWNGKVMNKDNSIFTGAMYKLQEDNIPKEMTWEWTDNNGKKYTNSVKVNPIALDPMPRITLQEDLVIKWKGLPVQENEEVIVSIEGEKNGKKDRTVKSISQVGATSISFSPEITKLYRDQAVSVEVSRHIKVPLEETTEAGGHIIFSYDGGYQVVGVSNIL